MAQQESVSSKIAVLSIEMGPVCSSLAFSLKHDWRNVFSFCLQRKKEMLPTALLLNPEKTFNSFGFEAQEAYSALNEDEEMTGHYYFPDFVKQLFEFREFCSPSPTIKDVNGKEVSAKELVSLSIEYFVDQFLSRSSDLCSGFCSNDMDVVLVLPCQCSPGLQNFMSDAAVKAGLSSGQVFVVSNAVASSLCCKYTLLNDDRERLNEEAFSVSKLAEKSIYFSVHVGDSHTTINVHQKYNKGIDPVLKTKTITLGSLSLLFELIAFLKDILGKVVIEEFERDFPEEYKEMLENIMHTAMIGREITTVSCEIALITMKIHEKSMSEILENRFKDKSVTFSAGKIKISSEKMKQLFTPVLKNIMDNTEDFIAQEGKASACGLIFSGKIVNTTLFAKFIEKRALPKLFIPKDPLLVVLKGAVYYGHVEKTKNVVSKSTYGIQVCKTNDSSQFPEGKKISMEGEEYCADAFLVFVKKGELLPPEQLITKRIRAVDLGAGVFRCFVYSSQLESPKFEDDTCRKIGLIEVPFPKLPIDCYEETEISMKFDLSCLSVEVCHVYKSLSFKVSLFDTDCIAC